MRDLVLSLYDFTGVALQPWVNAGYGGIAFDIQHNGASCEHYQNGGFMVKAKLVLGGKSLKTKNIRSATPRGFAQAVFAKNEPAIQFAQAYDEIQAAE